MAATSTAITPQTHVVEKFSATEWEDEAFSADGGETSEGTSGTEKGSRGRRGMSSVLKSSLGALRISSSTERVSVRSTPHRAHSREPSTGFVGSLLHGLANAVGLHREGSPVRDVSPSEPSGTRSKLITSQSRSMARLSSAALMRNELQNYSQFGDLRNDSFSNPNTAKLMRRSSQARTSDAGTPAGVPIAVPSPRQGFRTAASGDLSRHSISALPCSPGARNTCPGDLTSPFPTATAPTEACRNALTTPPRRPRSAHPSDNTGGAPANSSMVDIGSPGPVSHLASYDGALPPSGPTQRSPSGAGVGGVTGRVSSVTDMPRLHPPSMYPHPPAQPRPSNGPTGTPTSRSVSTDHLPPMQSPTSSSGPTVAGNSCEKVLSSARDQPGTPRGSRISISGSPTSKFAAMFGSFHLPEILTGGSPAGGPQAKGVTDRHGSVSGDGSVSRSRRNSVSGPMTVKPSGGSFAAYGNGVLGPGGAAISASIVKRAAAAAHGTGAGAGASGNAGGTPVVSPSGASATAMSRPPGMAVAPRVPSVTGKSPASALSGGILQDFQSSADLEEESSAATAEPEFDRRYRQSTPGAPLSNRPDTPSRGATSQQTTRPQPPAAALQPHAPRGPRRPNPGNIVIPPANVPGDNGAGIVPVPFVPHRTPRRQSCSATMFYPSDGNMGLMDGELAAPPAGMAAGGDGGEAMVLTSLDTIPSLARNSSLNAKMRLASIRLSYAEGIVPTSAAHPDSPALGGRRRASLDFPPTLPAQGPPTAWPQSPGITSRAPAPPPAPPAFLLKTGSIPRDKGFF